MFMMTKEVTDKKHPVLNILFVLSILLAFSFSFFNYYYLENFDYYVEQSCDPTEEECEYRDCVNKTDLCLPNKLSYYKAYYVKAIDFTKCSDNSCKNECDANLILCKPVE